MHFRAFLFYLTKDFCFLISKRDLLITFVQVENKMTKKPSALYLFTMGMTIIYVVFGLVLIFWERADEQTDYSGGVAFRISPRY